MTRPDFAGKYASLLKQEEDEMLTWMLEGYKSPGDIGEHAVMNDTRKRYDWNLTMNDAVKYCEDASQPLADRIAELDALVGVHPALKKSVPADFLELHAKLIALLTSENKNEEEAKALAETKLIPYGVKLLREPVT